MSIGSIQQSQQATTNYYLAFIFQQLNGAQLPLPPTLNLNDPTLAFTPPRSAVWVNGLWFLSLVISLTCALLSTLLQQWARRYLRVAYPRCSPHKQARIRAFYKHGVEKLHIPWAIELLPILLHISLFIFFAGLSVYLYTIDLTIFKVVTIWIAVCVVLYACLTFLPIIHKDSPYSAPLSASVSFCLTGIRFIFFRSLQRFPEVDPSICMPLRSRDPRAVHLDDFFSHSMSKTAEEFAVKLKPDIDYRSLLWTFDTLDEDKDLEKFFEALPRLCDSATGKKLELQQGFIIQHKKKLSSALIGLMNRTLTSNLVTEFVKQRRMIICTKVVGSTSLLGPWWILRCVLLGEWSKFLECIEFGLFVQNWKNITDKVTSFAMQCVAALTISRLRERTHDERWLQLACGLLDVSRSLLHKYLKNGDSILLANAIFIVRRAVQTYSGSKERHRQDILDASTKTLETVCKLDIGGTLPELQHQFCGLWNQLVDTALTDQHLHHSLVCTTTLRNIRKLYIALHENPAGAHPTPFYSTTDDRDPILENAKSYPVCTHDDHRPSPGSPPIPDLQFDEPVPDAPGDVAPNTSSFVYPPARPSTYTTPVHPSFPAPDPTSSLPFHCGPRPRFVDTSTHLAAPPEATIPFPQPQLTKPHALNNIPRWGNMQSPPAPAQTQTPPPPPPPPPPPLPPRSACSASPTHLGDVSTQNCSSGGHVWSSMTT